MFNIHSEKERLLEFSSVSSAKCVKLRSSGRVKELKLAVTFDFFFGFSFINTKFSIIYAALFVNEIGTERNMIFQPSIDVGTLKFDAHVA